MNTRSTLFSTLGMAILIASPIQSFADNASRNKEIQERFSAADKNQDGKLTLKEAEAGMPRVARNFDKIDTQHKGYVTIAEIEAMANK